MLVSGDKRVSTLVTLHLDSTTRVGGWGEGGWVESLSNHKKTEPPREKASCSGHIDSNPVLAPDLHHISCPQTSIAES